MNKRRSQYDFFDEMKNYKERKFNRLIAPPLILVFILIIPCVIITGLLIANANLAQWVVILMVILYFAAISIFLIILEYALIKNNEDFIAGKISRGLANLIFIFIISIVLIVLLAIFLPEKHRYLLPPTITALIALFCAVLASIGVHYSETKKREARAYKNKIFFTDTKKDSSIEYKLERDKEHNYTCLYLNNVSDNYGSFYGIYKIDGNKLYLIGKEFEYAPITPKTSYIIRNINYEKVDEQYILVYRDIEDIFYYIHFRALSTRRSEIIKTDKCDIGFIRERLNFMKRAKKDKFVFFTKTDSE